MTFRTIISAQTLAARIDDPSWRIVDCRHDLAKPDAGEHAYRASHIPNAQFLHVDRDLSAPLNGKNGRHPLPDPAEFAALLGRRGISNENQVVVYDDSGGMFAVRLWWMLRWLGHRDVAVLDGGLSAWQRAGYPLTDTIPPLPSTRFNWHIGEPAVDADYVQAHLRQPDMLLLDARAPDRFRGLNETLDPVAGHIPGAANRPFRDNLADDGCFKSPTQLREEFERLLNARPTETVVSYCGSGVTACHNLLAMEIANLHGARLYAGSWSEWCANNRRPIATDTD